MEETTPIRPRDKLLRDNFTPAEAFVFITLLIGSCLLFWAAEPRSSWTLGFTVILGGLTPFILKTHEHTHPFFIDRLWTRFLLYSSPAWIVALQYLVGLLNNPLGSLSSEGIDYLTLEKVSDWLPVSIITSGTGLTVASFCAIYILCSTLYIVPKSRSFIERLFPWLCLNAVAVAIFGYFQKGLNLTAPLLTQGTGQDDFFAFFPYDGHWAAFASIWCCACISFALLSTRYEDSPNFVESTAPWYLTGGVILGSTGFLVEAHIPAATLLLTLSTMLFIVAFEFQIQARDIHRRIISILAGAAGGLIFAAAIFRCFGANPLSQETAALRKAAWEMFQEQPIFGWGIDSFSKLLPFFAPDQFVNQPNSRAQSDLLQLVAELGIFGLLTIFAFLVGILFLYLRGIKNIRLTNHLFVGCIAVLILSIVDTPFMSPAVFFSFILILFSAMRWADLTRSKVDEVDASRPQLVTPESERRVPFFNKPYVEEAK